VSLIKIELENDSYLWSVTLVISADLSLKWYYTSQQSAEAFKESLEAQFKL
jgi:hypothetical protein